MRWLWTIVVAVVVVVGSLPVAEAAAPKDPWPDLTAPSSREGGGERDAAVIIGVEDYVFAPDIAGAAGNAEAWYRHLVSTRAVPAANVQLVRDDEATLEEMRRAVEAASASVQSGGTLWFVFIGHGAPSADGDDGLLVGTDAQQTAQSLEARSLRRSELLATLEASKGLPVVIIDACFSGRGSSGESIARGLQPMRVAELDAPTSALVLTAAKSNQYAGPLPGKDVPAFSYLMLGALRGWADADGDGRVTADEAMRYSGGVMRSVIKGRTQAPELGGPGDHVLGRGHESGPDLANIVLSAGRTDLGNRAPADVAPKRPAPQPAAASDGLACVDDRGCGEGTSCQGGVCRIDHVYIGRVEARAQRTFTAGAITLGIAAPVLTGVSIASAICSVGDADCTDDASNVAFSVLGSVSLAGVIAGITLLGVGAKRRKHARSLRGARGLAPSFVARPGTVAFGLSARF